MNENDKTEEGFLTRWSRRKQQAREGGEEPRPHDRARCEGENERGVPASKAARPPTENDEAVELAKLPKIEDLTAESDITAFLRKGVPEELRRLALRRAWALDPAIRDFVEAAENQYDWNVPGGVPGFGELAPETDVASLLAQATGRLPSPVAPAEGSIVAALPPQDGPAAGAHFAHVAADAETIPPAHTQLGPETQPSPTQSEEPSEHVDHEDVTPSPPHPRPRRHGGALPG